MKKQCVTFSVIAIFAFLSGVSYAQNRVQLSFGAGAGVFIASNEERYMDIKYDIYPEVFLALDISGIRLGSDLGLVYRKRERYSYGWDGFTYDSYTMLLLPLQGYIGLYPVKFFNPNAAIQPFGHIGAGSFISVGSSDYPDNEFCVTAKIGLELNALKILGFHGDIRYTHVNNDLGGVIISIGATIKIPIVE